MLTKNNKKESKMTNSSFTVSWRDIAKKLNPLYEDQGYAPPSDVQMQNAVLKAASVLNAKREKRSNRFYYEPSFLDDAVKFILKNPSFKLHKSEKYEARNFARKLTTEYLNAFDLLVTSSSTLNLQQKGNVEFEKTGWFDSHTLFNFLTFDDVKTFEKFQRETTLRRSLLKNIDCFSEYLTVMEYFALFAHKLLKDFDHIIISNTNDSGAKETLTIYYNILDFNQISQRIAEYLKVFVKHHEDFLLDGLFFANVDGGKISFLLYKESVLDFVSNHKESSIKNGENGQRIRFFKGDRYFWKQNL